MKNSILITAGESSGDIHAASLIGNLRKLNPNLSFFGIGGKKMEDQGVDLIEKMDKLSIIGVSGILSSLGRIGGIYKRILDRVKKNPPRLAVLVDYPGFNLVLAKALKKRGIPVIYYITPQVWAWGRFRIRYIKKYVDKALVIFRFEESLFKKYGIDAAFVGHPLLDAEKKGSPDRRSYGLDENKTTIALLPGSREPEVRNILPVMLETAGLIAKQKEVQFALLKSAGLTDDIYDGILKKSDISLISIKGDTYGCLSVSDFVFTASGTATLECAIAEKPLLIIYKSSFLTAFLFKIFAKTPLLGRQRSIGLVNIIAGRKVAPEILQYDARPRRLASEILAIISSKEMMRKEVEGLRWVKNTLGAPGASLRAARIINDFIQ